MTIFDRLDPVALLGCSWSDLRIEERLSPLPAPVLLALDDEVYAEYRSTGLAVSLSPSGTVSTVFLYLVPDEGFEPWEGITPGSVIAHDTSEAVRTKLGTPSYSRETALAHPLLTAAPMDRFDYSTHSLTITYSPHPTTGALRAVRIALFRPSS